MQNWQQWIYWLVLVTSFLRKWLWVCKHTFVKIIFCRTMAVPAVFQQWSGHCAKILLAATFCGCSASWLGDTFYHFINLPLFDDLMVIYSCSTSLFPQPLNMFACTVLMGLWLLLVYSKLCAPWGLFYKHCKQLNLERAWRMLKGRTSHLVLRNQTLPPLLLLRSQTHTEALCPSWTKTIMEIGILK